MPDQPKLSVVILSYNTKDLLRACLRSLEEDSSLYSREVIVVDNASKDSSADMVAEEFPNVKLIRNAENALYAEGNNIGARAAIGKYLCLLNSDTEVKPGALDQLVDFLADKPEYGAVGPKFVFPDGGIQPSVRRFPTLASDVVRILFPQSRVSKDRGKYLAMADFDHLSSRDVDQPMGACLVLDRYEFLDMGGFDSELSLFFNDVDLCQRLWENDRKIHYLASAVVMHHVGQSTSKSSRGLELHHKNRVAYFRKRNGWIGSALIKAALSIELSIVLLKIRFGRSSSEQKKENFQLYSGMWRAVLRA